MLAEFHHGLLPDDQREQIAEHLGGCRQCARAATNDDPFSCRLRNWLREENDIAAACDGEPECSQLAQWAKGLYVSSAERLSDNDLAFQVPAQLGKYQVLEPIARGGMGIVYKARHQNLGQVVALKIIAANQRQGPQAIARFQREWASLGRLIA